MSDSALGGRSSATPRSHTQETPGSQSSLLPRLKARRPERKIPAHFPPLDSGFRSVIIYLTVCVQQKNVTRESYRGAANRRSMGSGYFLVRRSLCHHARSHPFVLRTEYFSSSTAEEMDRVLENHVTREWTNRSQVPIWQREFWDRELRRAESYEEKWQYVKNNPARHGYVSRVEDWPYQGELNVLEWHDR